jgi:hypothetical protein
MDELERSALEVLLILGAFCLGVVLGSNTRRGLPPPDPRALRSRCEY